MLFQKNHIPHKGESDPERRVLSLNLKNRKLVFQYGILR